MKNNTHVKKYEDASGIYRLDCDCGSSYIGKTYRQFKRRIYEHKYSYFYNLPEKSNYAAHLLQNDHIATPFNSTYQILKIVHNKYMIEIWEQLFIQKQAAQSNLINEHHLNTNNPLFELLKRFSTLFKNQRSISVTLKSSFPISPVNSIQAGHSPLLAPPLQPTQLIQIFLPRFNQY